jgi:hypothetical protein
MLVALALAPGVLTGGCGSPPDAPTGNRYALTAVYAEPADSVEPVLVFPRDVLAVGSSIFVLDGRLSTVAAFDAPNGRLRTVFGGQGEGPGELGPFPAALVTDGSRVGVTHLFQVSWFTRGGEFLGREALPNYDLSTPSLQHSEGGWLVNAPFRGADSPVAIYISAGGDTVRFGESVLPPGGDDLGLVAMELNAVHAVRFDNGSVLVGWVQQNRIDLFLPDGELSRTDRWPHLPTEVGRRPDGRVRGMPGFTFQARLGADGLAYLLDGTQRTLLAYASDGSRKHRHTLEEPVTRLTWTADGTAYAIGGSDRLYRLARIAPPETEQIGQTGKWHAPPAWVGADLPRHLGTLRSLSGEQVTLDGGGLRLWALIDDRECPACLAELHAIARLPDPAEGPAVERVVIALGDRHEARRTLYGLEVGLPLLVSTSADLASHLFEAETPLKVLTWHGRVVGVVTTRVDEPEGRMRLTDLLAQWSSDP